MLTGLRISSVLISVLLLSVSVASAQLEPFDVQLKKLAEDVSSQIPTSASKLRVAVWDFTSVNGDITPIGTYIAEDFSVYLSAYSKHYDLVDRHHLATIMREHKLAADGYIDAVTAKELSRMNAADIIVAGTVTVFSSSVRLRVKILNTETALQIGAAIVDLPLTDNIRSFVGISGDEFSNRGFNSPLTTGEQYNNPQTVDRDCETKNFGDFCFKNSHGKTIELYLTYKLSGSKGVGYFEAIIQREQTQCFFELEAKPMRWIAKAEQTMQTRGTEYTRVKTFDSGQVQIEKCKSKTLTIR
jgi:hypothetical protein